MLNISVATIIMFIATIPEFIAFSYIYQGYSSRKYFYFLYMAITWFFLWLGNFLLAIAYLFLDINFYRWGIIITSPLAFAIMKMVDSISRENIDPIKLFIITSISTALFIFSFDENAIILNKSTLGDTTLALNGPFDVAGSLVFLFSGLLWLYYMTKIYINAPAEIKRYALINLIGAILIGPGSIIAFGSGIVWIFPGTDYILIALGALLSVYAFRKAPQLGFILRVKVYRLVCINSESGVPLYSYNWSDNEIIDDIMLSGALKGINSILIESVKKGFINQIKLEESYIIFYYLEEQKLMFILFASEIVPLLNRGIVDFSHRFTKKFEKILKETNIDLSQFNSTDEIIKISFPFVPKY
ncbi:MAG: hypothetical protein ACTSU2_15560 [Promethearchaeota archaeon]